MRLTRIASKQCVEQRTLNVNRCALENNKRIEDRKRAEETRPKKFKQVISSSKHENMNSQSLANPALELSVGERHIVYRSRFEPPENFTKKELELIDRHAGVLVGVNTTSETRNRYVTDIPSSQNSEDVFTSSTSSRQVNDRIESHHLSKEIKGKKWLVPHHRRSPALTGETIIKEAQPHGELTTRQLYNQMKTAGFRTEADAVPQDHFLRPQTEMLDEYHYIDEEDMHLIPPRVRERMTDEQCLQLEEDTRQEVLGEWRDEEPGVDEYDGINLHERCNSQISNG